MAVAPVWPLLTLFATAQALSGAGDVDALVPDPPVIVKFYAPWCPVCQRFEPVFRELGGLVESPTEVVAVNCDHAQCEAYGVDRYPTVLAVLGTIEVPTVITFAGPWDYASFYGWLVRLKIPLRPIPGAWASTPPAAVAGFDAPATPGSGSGTELPGLAATPADAFDGFERLIAPHLSEAHGLDTHGVGVILAGLGALPGGERYACLAANETECPGTLAAGAGQLCNGRFPCSAWAMMHTLVSAAASDDDAIRMIWALAMAILEWFPCQECVEHFSHMVLGTDAYPLASVKSRRGAILWLWSAHNQVNSRTQPPRGVFPSPLDCPNCNTESDVVAYLETAYGAYEKPPTPVPTPDQTTDRTASLVALGSMILIGVFICCLAGLKRPREPKVDRQMLINNPADIFEDGVELQRL